MAFRPKRLLKKIAFTLLAIFLVLCLLEGLCTFVLLGWDVATKASPAIAERSHTEHDPDIGWIGLPDVSRDDLYGPGRHLTTNAQRFRGRTPTPSTAPDGKVRVLCSGDSFTLGYGVGDDDTWPRRLAGLDEKIETVNLGQGGYGIDQSFLWYLRHDAELEHHAHVFAFIDNDFERMRRATFYGYAKPLIRDDDGALKVTNTPVDTPGTVVPWLHRNGYMLEKTAIWRVMGKLLGRFTTDDGDGVLTVDESRKVAAGIFAELERRARERNADFVLVYIPMLGESRSRVSAPWRTFVAAEAKRASLHLVDLTESFRALPTSELQSYYIRPGEVVGVAAEGHLTPKGNALVAQLVYDALKEIPSFASRLR